MTLLKLGKKADTKEFPIVLILLIVVAIILFIALFPMIKDLFKSLLELLGVGQEKDTYIRSFEVEQGLEAAVIFRFRFINDQDIAGYELNATTPTGEKTMGVVDVTTTESSTKVMFDEKMRKDYLLNGKEIKFVLATPYGLNISKYTLYALDSSEKMLQKREVDWPGMFEDQARYMPEIRSFMDFAEGLKGLAASKQDTLLFRDDLVMLGFSSDFDNGNCVMASFNLFCGETEIKRPDECEESKTCLCLCRRVNNAKDYCDKKGRICYGYSEFEFIGGSRRTCFWDCIWPFCKAKGEDGEDNEDITIWKGKEFEDESEIFNSLAMVINDDSERTLDLNLNAGTMELVSDGKAISVKGLIISK